MACHWEVWPRFGAMCVVGHEPWGLVDEIGDGRRLCVRSLFFAIVGVWFALRVVVRCTQWRFGWLCGRGA